MLTYYIGPNTSLPHSCLYMYSIDVVYSMYKYNLLLQNNEWGEPTASYIDELVEFKK